MEIQRKNQEIAPITSQASLISILKEKKLIEISEVAIGMTIAKSKQGTPLGAIKKDNPREVYEILSNAFIWLQNSLNIKNPMSDIQIMDAAVTIATKYYFLRIEEIVMILGWIKTGKTGKLYQSFDVQTFCLIIEDYLKSDELASYYEQEANVYKQRERLNKVDNEGLRQIYEKLYLNYSVDRLEERRNERQVDDKGREIVFREEDYFNNLKELLPKMSESEVLELRRSFIRQNYKDGIKLLNEYLENI